MKRFVGAEASAARMRASSGAGPLKESRVEMMVWMAWSSRVLVRADSLV